MIKSFHSMTDSLLLVLTGVNSAVGKDSVLRGLLDGMPQMQRIVTVNTRPIRPEEIDGKDHYFRSKQEFQKMLAQGEFFEWKEFAGNFYGTPKNEIEKVLTGKMVIWRIDPVMALKVEKALKHFFGEAKGAKIWDKTLIIFIDAPDKNTLLNRMIQRGAKTEEIQARLNDVWEERNQIIKKFDHVIVNEEGKLNQTIKEVANLINNFRTNKN